MTGIPASMIRSTDSITVRPPSSLTACAPVSFITRIAERSASLLDPW